DRAGRQRRIRQLLERRRVRSGVPEGDSDLQHRADDAGVLERAAQAEVAPNKQACWLLSAASMHRAVLCVASLAAVLFLGEPLRSQSLPKLDAALQNVAAPPSGRSRIIVRPLNATVDLLIQSLGGTLGRPLPIVDGRAADLPDIALPALAASAAVA